MIGGDNIKATRTEQQKIKKSHPLWDVIDKMCFNSKNLYNEANYVIRQEFILYNKYINYYEINKEFKTHENYKLTMSQPANCTLRLLDKNWKSYFAGIKGWNKNKDKYLGMPRIPKYLKKDGRYIWMIPNNSCSIKKDGKLHFAVKRLQSYNWKTRVKGRLIQVRFVPHSNFYMMEIVTEVEVSDVTNINSKKIASIDLGVGNFITMTNNIGVCPIIINGKGIKSINQFYNKQRAKTQSELMIRHKKYLSNRFNVITEKRNARIKNYIHCTSKYIVEYCKKNNIDTLVCGINKEWKQKSNMGKVSNQKFITIPYDILIRQLEYKCQDYGIKFITTEESYTSGTSFLDGEIPCKENYDKSRRIQRGLFQSSNQLINSDVNGSLQIMRKVFPDAFYNCYGIEGILTPMVISVAVI